MIRFFENWFRVLGAFPLFTLLIGGLGLFLVLAALWLLRRRGRRGELSRSRIAVMLGALMVGLCLSSAAIFVTAQWPPAFRQAYMELFVGDFADAQMLEGLKGETFVTATEALPGAWPQWRGPRRDGVSRETGLRLDWQAKPPTVLWRQPLAWGYSSVSVVGDRLYTQDKQERNERVLCLAAGSGKLLWSHSYPAEYGGFISHRTGPRATPTVHEGRVYAVGARGMFFCLEAAPADGQAKVLWQHDLLAEFDAEAPGWGVSCSPLIEGHLVIVQPGGVKGSVAAFDRVSGKLVWSALADPSGYSSPVAATAGGQRQIIAFTGAGLAGLRPTDGKQLWYHEWHTSFAANVATPVVAGNYVFLSSDYSAGCVLLKLSPDGAEGVKAEPVYLKRNKLMRNHQSTCVLQEGYLYGFDSRGSDAKRVQLRCFDLRTGEEKWGTPDIGKGVPILVEGHLLALFESGELLLAEATPQEYREKGRFQVFEQGDEVWALPSLAAGRLYLRSHKEVVCLDLRKSGSGK